MPADSLIARDGPIAVPADYQVPNDSEIVPIVVTASFNGAAAAGSFHPCYEVLAPNGTVIVRCPLGETIAAGASADVSWFPGASVIEEVAGGPTVDETLYYDVRAASITAASVLESGVQYLITVQGTYSAWNEVLDRGVPEANAMFPPGAPGPRVSTEVGLDPETLFAYPSDHPHVIGHSVAFQINLGSGFAHVEPSGGPYASPAADHFYSYTVTGQGAAPSFRLVDSPNSDNYGLLKITLYASPAGGGVVGLAAADGSIVVGGSASAATVRTGTLDAIATAEPPAADWSNNSHKITNVTDPTNAQDAATKNYVDTHGGGGGVTSIGSSGGSITVTNPTGPAVNVDLPASGVGAGTYGDATHVAQVAVNALGIITGISNVGISGIGSFALIYSSTLGAPAASIDTGAGAIPGTYTHLLIFTLMRTSSSLAGASRATMRFNNDSGTNYPGQLFSATAGTLAGASSSDTGFGGLAETLSTAAANAYGASVVFVPFYANALWKTVLGVSWAQGGQMRLSAVTWQNVAAISRIAILDTAGGGNQQTGSALFVYGIS